MISKTQKTIRSGGTTTENEPIIKSDGASSDVMEWQSSDENSSVKITEDASNNLDLVVSTGNVGLGTTSPTVALDVRGESVVGNGTDGVKLTYSSGNSTGIIDTGFSSTGLEFRTGNSLAAKIDSTGLATFANGIAVTTGGIKFPDPQSASADANTLDDYDEGTCVPVIGGGTCTNLVGKYTRVGNKVTILVSVANGTLASATDNQITGLPFTCGATRSTSSMVAYYHLLEVANPIALLDGGSTTIYMISNQAGSTWAHNDFTNCTGAYLHFSLTYFV